MRLTAVGVALSSAPTQAAESTLPAVSLLGVLVNLALVLGLIGLCAWVYARTGGRFRSASGALDIVASRQVGNRERLAVVQVGDEQVLLGITANGISHLHTLSAPLTTAAGASGADGSSADGNPPARTFGDTLRAIGNPLKRGQESS